MDTTKAVYCKFCGGFLYGMIRPDEPHCTCTIKRSSITEDGVKTEKRRKVIFLRLFVGMLEKHGDVETKGYFVDYVDEYRNVIIEDLNGHINRIEVSNFYFVESW
jgi:hypothetical protein